MRPNSWSTPWSISTIIAMVMFGVFLILLDVISKQLTIHYLPYGTSDHVIFTNFFGIDFSLTHATNTGAAWGCFGAFPHLLLGSRLVLIVGLMGYLFFFLQGNTLVIPIILIISGAIGNVVDFFLYGHVIDMLHFVLWGYDWPVFNVADMEICIGTFWIVLNTLFEKDTSKT